MYFDIKNTLVSEKEIKKLFHDDKQNRYFLELVEGVNNPKYLELTQEECSSILQKLLCKGKKSICKIEKDYYFIKSIDSFESLNNNYLVYYNDGSFIKLKNINEFTKLKNACINTKNNEEYIK